MTEAPNPGPQGPDGPRVPMSQPKKELEAVKAVVKSDNPFIIEPTYVSDIVPDVELDREGFLVDGNGEYHRPYAYDEDKFLESDEPGGFYFSDVYRIHQYEIGPQRHSDIYDRIHIRDVYGFYPHNGETIVIRDNSFEIAKMIQNTGLDIKFKVADVEDPDVPEKPDELTMVECNVCGTDFDRFQDPPEGATFHWVPNCPECRCGIGEPEPTPKDIGRWLAVAGDSPESRMYQQAMLAAQHKHRD